ncbi:hypothetical protein [Pontibacter sp. SGAir0037]|uniref:hypothetical protein n=1 Tax=Pontibacter sp. SGAir0037 TaxID=2571030 RepID=UPI0010F6099A|nr:hypothetical protein [Pontibacter sp. SGAir0037]
MIHTHFNRASFFLIMLCLCFVSNALGQSRSTSGIVQSFDKYRLKALQEKLFLHLDRPAYISGETLWFKAYTVDGDLHKPLDISKVAYVEVLNAENTPVLQAKIPLSKGMGNGSFILPFTLESGQYTVRAYTSWMKNFSPDFFFHSQITIVNTLKNAEAAAPALQNREYEVQFFPESGNLLSGIENKVAFKAVDIVTGKGIDFEGELRDEEGDIVAQFTPAHLGIGHFNFIPKAGVQYVATLRVHGKEVLSKPLDASLAAGYHLKLLDNGPETINLTLQTVGMPHEQLYLLGHARQIISVSEDRYVGQEAVTFSVPKSSLSEGITHFTVFNSKGQPVCERLYFKRPAEKLLVEAIADKDFYANRDKVKLSLETSGSGTKSSVPANLSMAVYKLDAFQQAITTDMGTYLWLLSDLKGTIEDPDSYFKETLQHTDEAIDNLLLTHGWSRFAWKDILDNKEPVYAYLPEMDGHFIQGKVTKISSGIPVSNVTTYLGSPGKHIRFYNAVSNMQGEFRFEVKDFFGAREIVVQANNAKDTTYSFQVYSPFSNRFASQKAFGYNITSAVEPELAQRHLEMQVHNNYFKKYTNLFKAPLVDSLAFYGIPDDQYLLDDYKRFKVMEEVMREYVPRVMVRKRRDGFHFHVHDSPHKAVFEEDPLVLLDGVPVFDVDRIMAFDPLKVKRLDVTASKFLVGPHLYNGIVSYATYNGDLGGFKLSPHALLMEYEGMQLEREFYAPTYDSEAAKSSRLADFRNLLFWSPNLRTDKNGKGTVEFYTSDLAGKYIIVVQGLSADGKVGSKILTLEVKQPI